MLSEKDIKRIKNKYPIGTRIKLHHMEDSDSVPTGTLGTVEFIDAEGSIHMRWDNGRSLALIENEDDFEIIEKPNNNIDKGIKL